MVIVDPGVPVGGSAAQRAAKAELARPEYHRGGPSPLTRALRWIGRQLGDVFSGGSGGSHAILLLLIVLLAAAIFVAVRAGVPKRTARAGRGSPTDPLAPAAARDHRRIAAELTAAGRRDEALREWLRAAIATIEERGVLAPRPGRTGATTAREAGPLLPAAAPDLEAATRAFDQVWFGGRSATDADVAGARTAADAVGSGRIATAAGAGPDDGLARPW
jgi:uncharacterized protein DUF4129